MKSISIKTVENVKVDGHSCESKSDFELLIHAREIFLSVIFEMKLTVSTEKPFSHPERKFGENVRQKFSRVVTLS